MRGTKLLDLPKDLGVGDLAGYNQNAAKETGSDVLDGWGDSVVPHSHSPYVENQSIAVVLQKLVQFLTGAAGYVAFTFEACQQYG
jgi:hypothetical protein